MLLLFKPFKLFSVFLLYFLMLFSKVLISFLINSLLILFLSYSLRKTLKSPSPYFSEKYNIKFSECFILEIIESAFFVKIK